MKIAIGHGKFTIIDDNVFNLVSRFKWHISNSDGRSMVATTKRHPRKGQLYTSYLHRIILGVKGNSVCVLHKNFDGLDNRKKNLIVCNRSQVASQRVTWAASKLKGVYKVADSKLLPWKASIRVKGKFRHLGCHKTPELAAIAYDKASLKYFGRFARLNFPLENYVSNR